MFSACYKDIDMEKYRPEPTLVLNSITSPDTIVMAQVAKTVFFTEHRDSNPYLTDAKVELYVNGDFIETMPYDKETEMYISSFRPSEGDTIVLNANSHIGKATGCAIVPKLIKIESVRMSGRVFDDPDLIIWTPEGGVFGKSYEINYYITFTDNPSERNFYFIRIEGDNGLAAETLDFSHDDVFLEQQSAIDGVTTDTGIYGNEGRSFNDYLFNGRKYSLKIIERAPLFTDGKETRNRKIILYSISESYYHYLTGIFNFDEDSMTGNLINWGFSEPSPHYTNIKGGTGIVGAIQSHYINTDINQVIKTSMD